MIPTLCNPVATQPSVFLPFKGDTNDKSINNYTVTNNGATTSTGIFGESNGSYNFPFSTYCSLSSSVGNTVATYLNLNCTILWWNKTTVTGGNRVISRQYESSGQRSWFVSNSDADNKLYLGKDTGVSTLFRYSSNNTSNGAWEFLGVRTSGSNGINVSFVINNLIQNTTLSKIAKENSTTQMVIGGRADTSGDSLIGDLNNFGIYDVALFDGEIAVLNQQKGRIAEFPSGDLLLNVYSGSVGAYSLRKLQSSYSGSAIRVRRASDNTEQDIGFSSRQLDTSTLATFCSGTDGFVTTWYDQSGSGNNATQATTANQPKIYDSSTGVLLQNGEPALFFDGSNDGLILSAISGTKFTSFSVSKFETQLGIYQVIYSTRKFSGGYSNYGASLIASSSNSNIAFNTRDGNPSPWDILTYTPTTNQTLISAYNDGAGIGVSNMKIFDNGVEKGSLSNASPLAFSPSNYYDIGQERGIYPSSLHGYIQEILMFNEDHSSNRTAIEANINDYYAIY